MKKFTQTGLWVFLFPATLVTCLGFVMNLLLLNYLEEQQRQDISVSVQQLATVSETAKLLEDLGYLYAEVASMPELAAKHELDEAGTDRIQRHVVNELLALEQRLRVLQAAAAEFAGEAIIAEGMLEEFSALRAAAIKASANLTSDFGQARENIAIAERRLLNISHHGHELSRRLAEAALRDVSASGQEMKQTFWRITLIGLGALLVMLALSLLFAAYLSRQRRLAEVALEKQNRALAASEADARAQRRFLRTLIQTIPDLVWLKDTEGVFLLCNPRIESYFGKAEAEIIGKSDYDFLSKAQADCFRANDLAALSANGPRCNEEEFTFADDGHKEWVLTIKTPMLDAQGEVIGVLGISRDMSAIKAAEEAMRLSLDKLNEAQRIARLGSWTLCLHTNRFDWSDEGFRIFEIERELYGATYETLLETIHPDDREAVFTAFMDARKTYVPIEITHRLMMPDGRIKYVQSRCETLFDADGSPTVSHGTTLDISELQRANEQIHLLAYYDALTGLPNRSLLSERLAQRVAAGCRQPRKGALILLNIDRFKNINEARGIALGDRLLQALGQRLREMIRADDTVARLSADEFAILLPDTAIYSAQGGCPTLAVGDKFRAVLRQSFIIDGDEVAVTASLGITLFPEGGNDTQGNILRRADMAMHRAKAAGGNQSVRFEIGMDDAAFQRFTIESELRRGIPAGELRLYLQPQVDDQEQVVGAEALVRWQHPVRGLLPPGIFIPVAEESDLIVDLGAWMLAESCRLMAQENMAGNTLHLSVNLSPRHFRQPDFVAWIRDLLASTGADPTHLTLEITEGLVINNIDEVVSKMSELTSLGIHFSLDDFGTGYSSLAYLKRLPIHELKIDKSFVQDAPTDPNDAALVETILAVARHMRLTVVAEGVETQEQADFLNSRATLVHQGYLYGKPEPADVWLERWRQTKRSMGARKSGSSRIGVA